MMLPMQIHELLGAGIRAARMRKGWRQQDASAVFRSYGLPTWKPGAVGQVEAGVRKPSIGELLLACAALEVSIADLVPDVDEPVDLGAGATMTSAAVRALLSGNFAAFPRRPEDFAFPGEAALEDEVARAGAERDRQRSLLQPLVDAAPRQLSPAEMNRVFLPPTDAESHAAGRLNVEPVQLRFAARVLWARDFEEERDARAGDAAGVPPKTLQARRGHASRSMLAELKSCLDQAKGARQPVVAAIVTSALGVLVGRRNDGTPPWTFIAGESEPGEEPADTAVREVKEETTLEATAGEILGERVHPATGRRMIYMAARPARGTDVYVGDVAELAEVRWVGLAEADELLPGMFGPVREHLARELGEGER
jgi:8-oxo-dGTP diphosphatase